MKDDFTNVQQRISTITDQINKNEVLVENNIKEDQEYDQRLTEETQSVQGFDEKINSIKQEQNRLQSHIDNKK